MAEVHKLPVNLADIEEALDNTSYDMSYVLDLQTGDVLMTTSDASSEAEEIFAEIDDGEGDVWAAFEAELARRDSQEWWKDAVLRAAHIQAEFGTRYRAVERDDPHAGYRDMEDFIYTIEDAALQDRLDRAIRGRGAFRHFKDVLLHYPAERERWFEFQSARQRQRALDWLRHEGIEPE